MKGERGRIWGKKKEVRWVVVDARGRRRRKGKNEKKKKEGKKIKRRKKEK